MMKKERSYTSGDVFFKYALTGNDEGSHFLLRTLIESITGGDGSEFTLLNPDIIPDYQKKKEIILDVLVKTHTGEQIDIEMQRSSLTLLQFSRFEHYVAKLHGNQLQEGESYKRIRDTYQIILIDDLNNEKIKFSSHFTMTDEDGISMGDTPMHSYFIYLPYINEMAKSIGFKGLNSLEKIIYIFQNDLDDDIITLGGKEVKTFMSKVEGFTKEERLLYLEDEMHRARMMNAGLIEEAQENGFDEGKAQGLQEGKAQGLQEGKAQGLQEGKAQGLRDAIFTLINARFPDMKLSFLDHMEEDDLKELLLRAATITREELDNM